jgi:RNA polymerase sigma-70 factor (ECF subfamily)
VTEGDGQLLERCRRGDEAAWHELVTRHSRKVFGLCYRFAGRVDEAEDLTQEAFLRVYQNLDRYRSGAGAFSTWLMTVARNHAIDQYRRRREERQRRDDSAEGEMELLPSGEEGPVMALERKERVQLVQRGLRALPQDLREPIVLCDLQGLAYEEAAKVLAVPIGTVKSRLNRGRLELAKRLLAKREAMGRP